MVPCAVNRKSGNAAASMASVNPQTNAPDALATSVFEVPVHPVATSARIASKAKGRCLWLPLPRTAPKVMALAESGVKAVKGRRRRAQRSGRRSRP